MPDLRDLFSGPHLQELRHRDDTARPGALSPEDHYGVYRRRLKKKVEGEKNG
jgi:hypothetical protein